MTGNLPPGGKSQLEFPLEWRGKIIGYDTDSLPDQLQTVLSGLGLERDISRGRCSRNGRYVTYHATVTFVDRDLMTKALYALSCITGVKTVL